MIFALVLQPHPENCYAYGLKNTAGSNTEYRFQVHLLDEDGEHCWGDHKFRIMTEVTSPSCLYYFDPHDSVSSTAERGVYQVSFYTPHDSYSVRLAVHVNGVCLRGFPFVINDQSRTDCNLQ